MRRFHHSERKADEILTKAHRVHGSLYRYRIDLTEERVDERQKLQLQFGAALSIAGEEAAADLLGLCRHHVGEHGDHTAAAQREQRNDQVIISGVEVQLVADKCHRGDDLGQIAVGFLDGGDAPQASDRFPVRCSRRCGMEHCKGSSVW